VFSFILLLVHSWEKPTMENEPPVPEKPVMLRKWGCKSGIWVWMEHQTASSLFFVLGRGTPKASNGGGGEKSRQPPEPETDPEKAGPLEKVKMKKEGIWVWNPKRGHFYLRGLHPLSRALTTWHWFLHHGSV
jgi:hypothetical protein